MFLVCFLVIVRNYHVNVFIIGLYFSSFNIFSLRFLLFDIIRVGVSVFREKKRFGFLRNSLMKIVSLDHVKIETQSPSRIYMNALMLQMTAITLQTISRNSIESKKFFLLTDTPNNKKQKKETRREKTFYSARLWFLLHFFLHTRKNWVEETYFFVCPQRQNPQSSPLLVRCSA